MATVRLTKGIKEDLLDKLIERAFHDRAQDLVNRAADFARQLYEDAYSKHLEQIREIPEGWLQSENSILVNLGYDTRRFFYNGTLGNNALGKFLNMTGAKIVSPASRPLPAKFRGTMAKQYSADHRLSKEGADLIEEWKILESEISQSSHQIMAVFDKCSSVKKLMEVWPEVAPLAKPYLGEEGKKANLPAIPLSELNQILDLPPDAKAAA